MVRTTLDIYVCIKKDKYVLLSFHSQFIPHFLQQTEKLIDLEDKLQKKYMYNILSEIYQYPVSFALRLLIYSQLKGY